MISNASQLRGTSTKTTWKLVLFAVRDDPELQAFAELYIAGVRSNQQVSAMLEVTENYALDLKSRLHERLSSLRVSIEAGKRLAGELSRVPEGNSAPPHHR